MHYGMCVSMGGGGPWPPRPPPRSAPAKEGITDQNSNAGAPQSKGGKYVKTERQGRKPITCYGCGEVGHIRPNCPNKVRRVSSPDSESKMEVDGWLAGAAVKGLKVDTGADRSVISAEYVPKNAYLDKSVILDSWRGKQFSKHRLARLSLKVADTEVEAVFAVADKLDCPALLGKDLGSRMTVQLLSLVLDAAKAAQSEIVNTEVTMQKEVKQEVVPVRVTRAQKKRVELDDCENDRASAESESNPLPLSEISGFEDRFFEDDPVPTPVEDCEVLPGVGIVGVGIVDVGVGIVDVPLPVLVNSDSDCLVKEQQADATLKPSCVLASKLEKGYSFQDGILVHTTSDGLGDSLVRILVPKPRRLGVLNLAHTHMLAGHFGCKKTFGRLCSKFLWPRMWMEVKNYVRTCVGCQKAGRKDKARTPLQPLQCESEPFSKVAFDLVGPLPRSVNGYRYILTMMDLYTKFPAAIPLKRVDNVTVIDAMMEVFSCFGLPKVLLTDQGSVFTSKLTKAMCKEFGITKIQTTPYHPQSDGALERWHACHKGMLKRSESDIKNWDRHLKYLLFAYRSTPHCITGFSPFTLMYGRDVRGPLDILQESWLVGDCEQAKVFEWLVSVKARMSEMSEVVSEKERRAKAKMKEVYDRTASVKKLEPGDMVLVWKPGIHAKMGASWDGPFQIESKVSPVTYRVQVPGKAHLSKVLHSNLLKKWSSPAAKVHRVAIVQEEDEDDVDNLSGLKLGREDFVPSEQQQASLDRVLALYP